MIKLHIGDIVTLPIPSSTLLASIPHHSLLLFVFADIGTGKVLQAALGASLADAFDEEGFSPLENHIASITGKEAALFCISGTMANQVALRTHLLQPPMGILADHRSHILTMEAGGVASLAGAMIQSVIPSNGIHLCVSDVRRCMVIEEDIYSCPTRVISLENPHSGVILPLAELQKISTLAKAHDIPIHIDGARLWEAVVAGASTLEELCQPADSVSLCFTKGLCAPVGSVLVGSSAFIHKAKKFRKSVGGAMRQPGIALAMAAAGLYNVFGRDGTGKGSRLAEGHRVARELAEVWTAAGGELAMPVQTNVVFLDLEAAGISVEDWEEGGARRDLRLRGPRIVTHCRK